LLGIGIYFGMSFFIKPAR